jgi:hypothetical protein
MRAGRLTELRYEDAKVTSNVGRACSRARSGVMDYEIVSGWR